MPRIVAFEEITARLFDAFGAPSMVTSGNPAEDPKQATGLTVWGAPHDTARL